MRRFFHVPFFFVVFCLLTVPVSIVEVSAQAKLGRLDRDRAIGMLKNVRNKIKGEYYDPEFKKTDIDARFADAEEQIKLATTLGEAFGIIAHAVMDLNDSHTRFAPPSRNAIVNYGWNMRMHGDKCLVYLVQEGSDAEKKGLEVGDQIVAMNRFQPTRSEMWKMIYYYQTLNPQARVNLVIRKPDGQLKEITVESKVIHQSAVLNLRNSFDLNDAIREGDRLQGSSRHRFVTVGNVRIWQMPSFAFEPRQVDEFVSQFSNRGSLILDLRGNPGGYVVTLERLAGHFFSEDKKIADRIGRKKMDPMLAKGQGDRAYKGKVVVLIDSGSGSAAEIFARLMQLEDRGVVVGDVSAGAVMQSRFHGLDAGSGTVIQYGVSVTDSAVLMSDGKSLEHVGVIPDHLSIPSALDIARGHDPALAKALELAGAGVDPQTAGKLFPKEKYLERRSNLALYFDF